MSSPDKLAFGVEPANRRFRLRLARYQGLAEAVRDYVAERTVDDPDLALEYLEVGVGTGRTLRYYEGLGIDRQLRLHAVDINPDRLGVVYRKQDWELHQGDAEERLPFDDARFDVVVSEQLLEHLRRPDAALAEFARVLRPGGLAAIGVPTFPPGLAHVRPLAVAIREKVLGKIEGHIQSFTAGDIVGRVRATGAFEDVRAVGYRFVSGGLLAPLEDHGWWYRLNRQAGALLPGLCVEVQVLARRR